MDRIGSGSPFEDQVGYSRVVRAGNLIWVAGCTATDENGVVLHPGDIEGQARQALTNVGTALSLAGATFADVVRTRMFVTDISRWHDIARAHADVFGAARPVSSMLEISALIDPRMMVEIEADAYVADPAQP